MGIGKNIFRTVWGVSKLNIESQRLSKKLSHEICLVRYISLCIIFLKTVPFFSMGEFINQSSSDYRGLLFQDSFLVGDMIITRILFFRC